MQSLLDGFKPMRMWNFEFLETNFCKMLGGWRSKSYSSVYAEIESHSILRRPMSQECGG